MLLSARSSTTALLGALIVLGAIGLWLLGIDKSIWLDEHLSIALVSREDFLAALRGSDKPPLYFLLLRLWGQLGESDAFLRLLSVLTSAAALLVLMQWLRCVSSGAALLGGLLFATLPLAMRYAQEIRNYSLLLLLTAMSFAFAARLARDSRNTRLAVLLCLTLMAAVATHLIAAFLVTSVLLYVISMRLLRRGNASEVVDRRILLIVIGPVVAALGFSLLFLERLPAGEEWWMPAPSLALIRETSSRLMGADVMASALAQALSDGGRWAPVWPAVGLWLGASLVLLPLGDWRSALPALLAALAYWVQLALFSLFLTPILGYRTALLGMVPMLAFLAIQATTIRLPILRHALLGLAVGYASLCAWTWVSWKAWQPYEPWKELATALEAEWRPGDLIVVHPAYALGPLRHYLSDGIARAIVAVPLPQERSNPGDSSLAFLTSSLPGTRGGSTYLVVRHDANVRRAPGITSQLDALLWKGLGERLWEKRSGGLAIGKYGRPSASGRARSRSG